MALVANASVSNYLYILITAYFSRIALSSRVCQTRFRDLCILYLKAHRHEGMHLQSAVYFVMHLRLLASNGLARAVSTSLVACPIEPPSQLLHNKYSVVEDMR